jgi:hypothetical protein
MFVSFGEAATAVSPRLRALLWPERGVFGVVDGDVDAVALLAGALDSGLRTSTRVDDVAEVIDGVHCELRERDVAATAAFALVVVEVDALAFFAMGSMTALLAGPGFHRRALEPNDDALGGEGAPKFFRAYVRAGDVVVLRAGRHVEPSRLRAFERSLADHARDGGEPGRAASAIARGSFDTIAVVLRVDEEPRIR